MMKILLTILFVISVISAQVIVEEEVSTDTVNLFDASKATKGYKDETKSVALAMLSNVLVPGLGQKYLGNERKAFSFFAIEAVAVLGTIFSKQYSNKIYSNSRAYASSYAGTRSNRGSKDEYWKNIAIEEYSSINNYNYIQELNRSPEKKYINDDDYWAWGSEEAQEKYRDMRETASKLQVTSSFFLGAMILNRAVSMIDGRISARRYNESVFSTISFVPKNSVSGEGAGIALVKQF